MRVVSDAQSLAPFHGCVLVPTMGALHAGHGALIERAVEAAHQVGLMRPVVVSIFVNRAQFNEGADFDAYPRTLDADLALCERLGADAAFTPAHDTVYPTGAGFLPDEPSLPAVARQPGLEDAARPGHFAGVYAVVKRLFELTRCSGAVFGEKDWQQLQVVRALVERESMRVGVVGCPTVRENDGLAMSSRNARLSPEERERASAVYAALRTAQGKPEPTDAERGARDVLEAAGLEVEYAAVRDARTLLRYEQEPGRVLIAARLGATRLIDNAPWPAQRT